MTRIILIVKPHRRLGRRHIPGGSPLNYYYYYYYYHYYYYNYHIPGGSPQESASFAAASTTVGKVCKECFLSLCVNHTRVTAFGRKNKYIFMI